MTIRRKMADIEQIVSFKKYYQEKSMKWWHIFLIALAVRFLLMVLLWNQFGDQFYLDTVTGDAPGYLSVGKSIAEGRGFQYHGITSALRTPMYPLFLSAFYYFHLPLWLVPVAQDILGAITGVLLFLIGVRCFSKQAGAIAGLLWAFEPYNAFLGNTIMSEALFIFLFVLSVYYFCCWYDCGRHKFSAITGFVLGLAVLTRPIAPFILAAVFLFFLIMRRWKINRGKVVISGGVFLAVFCFTIMPWLWRNYRVFGVADFTPVVINYAFYSRIMPMAVTIERSVTPAEASLIVDRELHDKIPDFAPTKFDHTFEYTPQLKSEATAALKRHWPVIITNHLKALVPGIFVTGWGEFLNYFWPTWNQNDPWLTGLLREGKYIKAFGTLGNPFKLTLVLGAIGWIYVYLRVLKTVITKRKNSVVWLLFTLAVLFVLLAVQPPMNVRYRMSSFPFLFLLFGAYEARFKMPTRN